MLAVEGRGRSLTRLTFNASLRYRIPLKSIWLHRRSNDFKLWKENFVHLSSAFSMWRDEPDSLANQHWELACHCFRSSYVPNPVQSASKTSSKHGSARTKFASLTHLIARQCLSEVMHTAEMDSIVRNVQMSQRLNQINIASISWGWEKSVNLRCWIATLDTDVADRGLEFHCCASWARSPSRKSCRTEYRTIDLIDRRTWFLLKASLRYATPFSLIWLFEQSNDWIR